MTSAKLKRHVKLQELALRNATVLHKPDKAWAKNLLPESAPEECYMPQNN